MGQKCYACDKEDHLLAFCNKTHYIPSKEVVILKENFSFESKERSSFGRKKSKTEKATKL